MVETTVPLRRAAWPSQGQRQETTEDLPGHVTPEWLWLHQLKVYVLVHYCYITSWSKLCVFKLHIHYLTVSVGQKSGHGLPESSGSGSLTFEMQSRCRLVLRFHLTAQPAGRHPSKFTHVNVGRIHSSWAVRLEVSVPHWLLARRFLQFLLHSMEAGFPQNKKARKGEQDREGFL